MAGGRAERDSRYYYDGYSDDDRDRERRTRRRRHRHREYDDDPDDLDDFARQERRERRRTNEARHRAEYELDESRPRREPSYLPQEFEPSRDPQRMAREIRLEREEATPRSSHREVRRDGTRRKKRRERVVADDRGDDYVRERPKSRAVIEEVTVRRSSGRRRSDEGGSSSRTAQTPRSGSNSASMRRGDEPKLSRSVSAREPTRVYMSTRPSPRRTSTVKLAAAPSAPVVRSQSIREHHPNSSQRRSTGGLFATLFRPPPPRTSVLQREVPKVECLICMSDEVPITKTAKLGCGHHMCYSCLKRQFTLSVSDPQHMPPTCCNDDHIPLRHVERLFDDKFKRLWNKRYQEYTTANRLYCPMKGCGEFIKPSKIKVESSTGRKYARCGRCSTKVCVLCNARYHTRRECPRDEETNRLVQMAKDKGWQRCYSCKAMVELKEGCNHMTCRCTAQFCMVCAAPWKTCNCPWFNYQHLDEEDQLNDMRVPYTPQHDVIEVIEMPSQPGPPPVRRSSTRIRRDRDLDRADEALAAHLHSQLRLDPTLTSSDIHRGGADAQVYGVGNSGGHHMNDSYAVRPPVTTTVRSTARTPVARSFFGRRISVRESPRAAPRPAPPAKASAMAGLSRDGTKRGANRVGTWLTHVEVDADAIATAPRGVEVDDWRWEGSVYGID